MLWPENDSRFYKQAIKIKKHLDLASHTTMLYKSSTEGHTALQQVATFKTETRERVTPTVDAANNIQQIYHFPCRITADSTGNNNTHRQRWQHSGPNQYTLREKENSSTHTKISNQNRQILHKVHVSTIWFDLATFSFPSHHQPTHGRTRNQLHGHMTPRDSSSSDKKTWEPSKCLRMAPFHSWNLFFTENEG